MPTYEYKCRDCGQRVEVWQPFSAEPLRECEQCGGELGKVFGNIGITFKGSGFYKTDSRSSATSKANGKDKADAKSETKSESKSDAKGSESKPAAKSESKSDASKARTPSSKGSSSQ